jgi:hypothetical protein
MTIKLGDKVKFTFREKNESERYVFSLKNKKIVSEIEGLINMHEYNCSETTFNFMLSAGVTDEGLFETLKYNGKKEMTIEFEADEKFLSCLVPAKIDERLQKTMRVNYSRVKEKDSPFSSF